MCNCLAATLPPWTPEDEKELDDLVVGVSYPDLPPGEPFPTDDHGVQTGPPTSDYEFGRAAVTFLACEAIYSCANVSRDLVEMLTRGVLDDGDGTDGLNNWERLARSYDGLIAAFEYMAENAEQDMRVPWLPTERLRQLRFKEALRQRYQESSGRGLLRLPVVVVKNPVGEQPPTP